MSNADNPPVTPLAMIKAIKQAEGINLNEMLVLSSSRDPFGAGRPNHVEKAEWFAAQWEERGWGAGMHLRRAHYALQSSGEVIKPNGEPYLNDKPSWNFLIDAATYARHLGFIDPTLFIDKRNTEKYDDFSPEPREDEIEDPELVHDVADEWPISAVVGVDGSDLWKVPEIIAAGYDYDPDDQPFDIEVWVEKSTINEELMPICERYDVNLMVGVGYQSITNIVEFLRRCRKPTRILYISDYDLQGESMPIAVAREVEFYRQTFSDIEDIVIDPVILTAEQVAEYDLPLAPDSDRPKAELDALAELHPGAIEEIVEARIVAYRDTEIEDKLDKTRKEIVKPFAADWKEITDSYSDEFELLHAEVAQVVIAHRLALRTSLALFDERLEDLRRAMASEADEFIEHLDIELPERPQAEVEIAEDYVLFDARRSFFEQLHYYRHAQQREPLTKRTCAADDCDNRYWPRRSNQSYCSRSCSKRQYKKTGAKTPYRKKAG